TTVPSGSISMLMRSGSTRTCWSSGVGGGISSLMPWVCTGSVMISITSSTSITSMSGTVLTSHIGSSAPDSPTLNATWSDSCSAAAGAPRGPGEERHLDDAGGLDGVEGARHVLVARVAVGLHVDLRRELPGGVSRLAAGRQVLEQPLAVHRAAADVDVAFHVDRHGDVLRL